MMRVLFMAGNDTDFFSYWTKPGSIAGQLLLVVGSVLMVGFVIFIWAAFFRKPRRHHQHHHHHSDQNGDGGLPARRKRRSQLARMLGKKRRRRRNHRERPVNPTLAQIGGLPPRRDDEPPA